MKKYEGQIITTSICNSGGTMELTFTLGDDGVYSSGWFTFEHGDEEYIWDNDEFLIIDFFPALLACLQTGDFMPILGQAKEMKFTIEELQFIYINAGEIAKLFQTALKNRFFDGVYLREKTAQE